MTAFSTDGCSVDWLVGWMNELVGGSFCCFKMFFCLIIAFLQTAVIKPGSRVLLDTFQLYMIYIVLYDSSANFILKQGVGVGIVGRTKILTLSLRCLRTPCNLYPIIKSVTGSIICEWRSALMCISAFIWIHPW